MTFYKTATALRNLAWTATRHPLAGRTPLTTAMRIVRWQFTSTLTRLPVVVPFVDDTFIIAEKGGGGVGVIYTGLFEPAEMCLMLHLLRPGDWFADIGANIGSYTILAAGVRQAQCIAAEPVPQTVVRLRRNLDLNHLHERVEIHAVGVASSAGELRFSINLDSENHVATSAESGVTVPTMPLDDLLRNRAGPTLLKIDVEGFEHEVLLGAKETLANPTLKAIIIELIGLGDKYGHTDAESDALLRSYGFELVEYDFDHRRLISMPSGDNRNGIYVRDRATVEQLVQAAPRFRVSTINQMF